MKISLATLTRRDPAALHCNTDIVPNGLPDPDPQGAAACTKLINDVKTNPSLQFYRNVIYSAANGSLPQASDPHFRTSDCAMVITVDAAPSSDGATGSWSGSQGTFGFNDWVAAAEGILASCMNWGATAQIGGQSGYTAGVVHATSQSGDAAWAQSGRYACGSAGGCLCARWNCSITRSSDESGSCGESCSYARTVILGQEWG